MSNKMSSPSTIVTSRRLFDWVGLFRRVSIVYREVRRLLFLGKINAKLSNLISQLFNGFVCICIGRSYKFPNFSFTSSYYGSSKISRFRSLNIDSELGAESLYKELFQKVSRKSIIWINTFL